MLIQSLTKLVICSGPRIRRPTRRLPQKCLVPLTTKRVAHPRAWYEAREAGGRAIALILRPHFGWGSQPFPDGGGGATVRRGAHGTSRRLPRSISGIGMFSWRATAFASSL